MNQQIIDKYSMIFENKIVEWSTTFKKLYKGVSTNNIYLTEFLNGWTSFKEIDELLLPDIEQALDDVNAEIDNGSETVLIIIYHDRVEFYYGEISGGVYEVRTNEFKEIVLNWKEFLLTPPLKI